MDVDSSDDNPPPPSAPTLPQEQPQSGTKRCYKEASQEEVEQGPIGPWAPSRQADGSLPETTRSVGIQANVGLERLARRLTWLKASRRRYRLNRLARLKRARASSPPPAPVSETAPAVPAPPLPPVAKRQKPSHPLPKKPLPSAISPPEAPRGQKGATGRGGVAKRGAGGRGQASKPQGKKGGLSIKVAKDQRVVVYSPPRSSATSSGRAPRETAPALTKGEDHSLPHKPVREPQKRDPVPLTVS